MPVLEQPQPECRAGATAVAVRGTASDATAPLERHSAASPRVNIAAELCSAAKVPCERRRVRAPKQHLVSAATRPV